MTHRQTTPHLYFCVHIFFFLLGKNNVIAIADGIITVLEKKALIRNWKHVQKNSWLHWNLESMFIKMHYVTFVVSYSLTLVFDAIVNECQCYLLSKM